MGESNEVKIDQGRRKGTSAPLVGKAKKYILKYKFRFVVLLLILIWFYFLIPARLFSSPTSTVICSSSGKMLGARIADDGQWRFPAEDSVPPKFKRLIMLFEDEYFYSHPGVNPVSMSKALYNNLFSSGRKRGGSTLTMQVARMARGNEDRNIYQKFIETFWALRIECAYSKEEILKLYASNAPFGGNVVGLSAASWRYYGRDASKLSWGEMAAIAVLPNAPALIFPGKNHEKLLKKRNWLLQKLRDAGDISNEDYELAIAEPLPGKPKDLPELATHLMALQENNGKKGERIVSTLNYDLQSKVMQQMNRFQKVYSGNEVHSIAAMIMEVKTGKVIAYVGNIEGEKKNYGEEVDLIQAPRSSGSILKPFLYASLVDEGMKLPDALLSDVPFGFSGYSPQNFEDVYDGVVPMSDALTRSLNVPFVFALHEYGTKRFLDKLHNLGFASLNRSAQNYGLSLILGGGEVRLIDLMTAYRKMSFDLQSYSSKMPSVSYVKNEHTLPTEKNVDFSKAAIWHTFETMSNVLRPRTEEGWQEFLGGRKVAWKTGTSFGHRDAWAVGVTPEYVVGVWVGNASGEGRPDLTGLNYAGPVLFRLFKLLPSTSWFKEPEGMSTVKVCSKSGYRAGAYCEETYWQKIHAKGTESKICPYHQQIFLDAKGEFLVNSKCYPVEKMTTAKWFVLPSLQAWYVKSHTTSYKELPPNFPGCMEGRIGVNIVYPIHHSKVFIPRNLRGEHEQAIFEVVHNQKNAVVYWHMDGVFLGSTKGAHRQSIRPSLGKHKLTVVDEYGNSDEVEFESMEK
ncbi:MAG: penicillin-binding protein 1C [Flavobacteriales bacterium]